MRITRLKYLAPVFLILASAHVIGQESVFLDTVEFQTDKELLQDVIQQFSDSTGLRFAYRKSLLEKPITQPGTYIGTVQQVLKNILEPHSLCFQYNNRQIIIHDRCQPSSYTISGQIVGDSSFQPIPYVSVAIPSRDIGVIASENGTFEIEVPWDKNFNDTLVISSMGFERDTILITPERQVNLYLSMREKRYNIPEIIVQPSEKIIIHEGNSSGNPSGSLYIDTHGQQTALFVKNSQGKSGIIKEVKYYLHKKGNTDAPFRVRVYDVDSAGLPGNDLVEDAIVVKPNIEKGWCSIDLSPLQIKFPEQGAFLAIEGVFPDEHELYTHVVSDEGGNIRRRKGLEMLAYGQRIGYSRKGKKHTWHYSMSKVWFQLEKQSFGVMISAVVEYTKTKEQTALNAQP